MYPFPGVLPVKEQVSVPDPTETLRPCIFDDPLFHEALAVLRCPICLDFRQKGVTLPECGHRFCKDCILYSTCLRCPVCRHPFEEEDTSYEKVDAVQHEEERHILLCLASFECGWCHTGVRLKRAAEHLQSCPERLVRCRCSKIMRLREHEEHVRTCRPAEPCVFGCSEATGIFFNYRESHQNLRQCHEYLLSLCRNKN